MKVGIDTFGCDHARSGLGTYLLSFTENVRSADGAETELFGSELDRYTYTSGKDIPYAPVSVPDSLSAERFWHFTNIHKFAQGRNYDAVLYPAPERVLPLSFKVPGVAIVNSVLSAHVEGNNDWIQKMQIKRGLYKIQKIVAASNFIKEDLTSHGISEEKIAVVHNGIDHKLFFPAIGLNEDIVDIKPFSIKRPYFIYGSRLSGPEKRHIELIRAFTLFKERTHHPHRLVIAGSDGSSTAEIHKEAFSSSAASDIFLTGYFPHESFAQLYSGSDACIFPSVNEGVGMPVLEAMATGVPVACSNSCALPEIAGDAALFFESDN
ncbi:MAG: glycosyltransferase family 4 protein, partial [Treponemataceae bacterium]|nr:glycosyltransferase family 4 protein [Treponemataceae bacterium]